MSQVVAVRGDKAAPVARQGPSEEFARAVAWECYTYDQASGNPEADDYHVRSQETINYSAARDGRPAATLCPACHVGLLRTAYPGPCPRCGR